MSAILSGKAPWAAALMLLASGQSREVKSRGLKQVNGIVDETISSGGGTTHGGLARNLNRETVLEGIEGCSFHMDVKLLYRFEVDPDTETVTSWSGDVGEVRIDESSDKRPIFMESSFQGMHGLDLSDERYLACSLASPAIEMHSFVVYFSEGSGAQRVLMDDSSRSLQLKTNVVGTSSSPSIAVGTADSLVSVTELTVGKSLDTGKVAEVVIFNRILSVAEEQFVYDGLVKKWLERTPRALPNVFSSLLGKTEDETNDAVVNTAKNVNANFFNTAFHFRGDEDTIFHSVGGSYSHFHPEWLAGIYYLKDKELFDMAINMMEKYHWARDDMNGGEWYFFAKAFISEPLHQTIYSGQGNHGYLGEVLYRAFSRWRDPRYLDLADRTMRFWLQHYEIGTNLIKSYMYTENNDLGFGKGIVKMFKNHILDDDSYSEVTYMHPMTARMVTEFGPAELAPSYDVAPHSQSRYLLSLSDPSTGLFPSTGTLNGIPIPHNGAAKWARFSNDATEKTFDRFLNSQLSYPEDVDADLLSSFRKIATWANSVGVNELLADYELDGSRNNRFHRYKQSKASEGMKAHIAQLATIAHDGLTLNMRPWVEDVWENIGNTDRSLRGFARSVFLMSGANQIENDALPKNHVSNPGFEEFGDDGSDDPGCSVATEAARRGSRGLLCVGQASQFVDAAEFQQAGGSTYSYSAWIRSPSGDEEFHLEVHTADASGNALRAAPAPQTSAASGSGGNEWQLFQLRAPQTSAPVSVGDEWQLVTMDVLLPANEATSFLDIKVVSKTALMTFHVDDRTLFLKSAPNTNTQDMMDIQETTTTTTTSTTTVLRGPMRAPIKPAVYVADIKLNWGQNKKGTKFNGRAWVTIHGTSPQGPVRVRGAEVIVKWKGATSGIMLGKTDSSGRVKFVSERVTGGGTYKIEVVDIKPPQGFDYSADRNVETAGSIVAPQR